MVDEAVSLLREIVRIPSTSKNEKMRADYLCNYLDGKGLSIKRIDNNIIVGGEKNPEKPTLMLNSHIDTVKASDSYTFDPFDPGEDEMIVKGLGSNDAGASCVSMIRTFLYFTSDKKLHNSLPFNLMLILSAEEECSGPKGITSLSDFINENVNFAIIGEPTEMQAAVAERGLLVIDGKAAGISGHAARNEGVNALYKALDDIDILRNYHFEKISPLMGDVKLTVTQINAGTQHNVIPDKCSFVVDIRPTDLYSNSGIMNILSKLVTSKLTARSLTNKTSITPEGHPLLCAIEKTGIRKIISPTTSDWMRLGIPAIKIGPGCSSRSHSADEYVLVSEISEAIQTYINIIKNITL